jgi:hypothetical protein
MKHITNVLAKAGVNSIANIIGGRGPKKARLV